MRDMEAKTVAETQVEGFISRMGISMIIYSDQGRNFESKLFNQIYNLLGIEQQPLGRAAMDSWRGIMGP